MPVGLRQAPGSIGHDTGSLLGSYFKSLPDIAYMIATDKTIITCNDNASLYIRSRFGKEVACGDEAHDYVEPDFHQSFDNSFTHCLSGERIVKDIYVPTLSDDHWWTIIYEPIRQDDKIVAVYMTVKNNTAVKKAERLAQQIAQVAKVGGWEMDLTKEIYTWSPVALQIYDTPEDYDLTLTNAIKFYKEGKSRAAVQEAIDNILDLGTSFDIEAEFITWTGKQLWVRFTGEAEYRQGNIHRLFGTFQDVTERRKVYEELKLSQQYYKSLFERNPDAVFALDLNEKVITANEHMAVLAETAVSNMTGKSFAPFCPPEDAESVMYYFNEAQKGNCVSYDCGFITARGNRREVNITNLPIIINGVVVAIYGIAKDMSEQVTTRNMVIQSEANLKAIFNNTEIGYVLLTDNFKIISFNKPAQNYIITKGQPPLQENEYLVTSYDDERGRSLMEIRQKVLAGEKVQYERNIGQPGKDGEWYNIIFHPVYGEEQNILGIIMEIENITARKKSELELERSLNLLNEQNKRLMNFSYITSHNLRSHTSNIKSIITFMEESESEEETREMMQYLKTVSNNLDETIHNLNDVVSINNSVNLIYRPLFLVEFISKATDVLKEQIIQKQAVIENKLMIDATVNFNPAFLESILLNFLSNALKYSHPDRPPVITLGSFMDNEQFVLTIADNGIGIDLEKNGDKLFGFYKTFNGNSDARGLGLFICKNQVEYMGGKIEVESELGKGTTFKIYFK